MWTKRLLPLAVVAIPLASHAETFFFDDFSYADGELAAVSNGTWTIPSVNNANPEGRVNDGAFELDWGVAATDPIAEGFYTHVFDASRRSTGFLYARFSLTPLETPSAGSDSSASTYFASFWNNGTGFRARLWYGLALDGGGVGIPGQVRFGMTDGSGSRGGVVWDTESFPVGEAIEVVVRYDLDNGVARLALNPSGPEDFVLEVNDASTLTIGGFGFRHKDDRGSGIDAGKVRIDDLAISDTFEVEIPEDDPPTNLLAWPLPGRAIGLTWEDNAQSETGYRVERRLDTESGFRVIGSLPVNATSYRDEDVVSSDRYVYRVSPEGVGDVGTTNEAEASPYVFFMTPATPEGFAEARGEGRVEFGVAAERQVSYQPHVSQDMVTWTRTGIPLGEGANGLTVDAAASASPLFFAFTPTVLDVPPGAGLTEGFALPRTGGGAMLDAAEYGMAPSTSLDQAPFLRAALAAASAGDTVEVPSGDYYVASKVTVPSGVILRGAPDGSTRFLVSENLAEFLFIARGSQDIEILDFAITAAGSSYEKAVTVNDRYTTPQVERVRIANLRISDFATQAISVRNARHVLVENTVISDATNLGGGGHGYAIELRDDHNHDNWVRDNVVGPVVRHGVLLQYRAHNNLIEGNTAIDNTEDAYDLHGEDEAYNELRGNLAYWRDAGEAANISAAGFGIGNTGATHDDTGPGNWIHHNTVYNYTYGVDVILGSHHQYIDGNHFYDLRSAGVRIANGGADFLYVRNNVFESNTWGIQGQSADFLEVRGNRFVSNAAGGISLTIDSTEYLITDNDFSEQSNPLSLANDEGRVFGNAGVD